MSAEPSRVQGPVDASELRRLGKDHFRARLERLYPPDVVARLKGDFEEIFRVRPGQERLAVCHVREVGSRLPIIGSGVRIAGRSVVTLTTDHGQIPVMGWRDGHFEIGFDLWVTLGTVLADQFNYPNTTDEWISNPVVDLLENEMFNALSLEFGPRQLVWPGGAPFVLGLSHDVDRIRKTFQRVTHAKRALSRRGARRALGLAVSSARDSYWCIPQITALEQRLGVRSTFFFLHEVPGDQHVGLRQRILLSGACRLDDPRVREILPQLRDGGWEIGLHSSSFARHDGRRLASEKQLLESTCKEKIAGVRQHFLAPHVPDLWRMYRHIGFEYDPTMGSSKQLVLPVGTCLPFPISPDAAFHQLPFEIMDGALRGGPESWPDCLRALNT